MRSVCILLQSQYDGDIRVRRKAEALVAAGYHVDVIALRSRSEQPRTYLLNGVRVYTISLGKKRGSLLRYAFEYTTFFLLAMVKLASLMRENHYAVVDVNNLPDFLVFAAAIARLQGAKIVFDMHEITPEFYMSKYGVGPRALPVRIARGIERLSIGFADRVITINEPIQDLLTSRGLKPSKSTVVMNSADESLFASGAGSSLPTDASRTQEQFVMMYHGTLTHIYGLDIAIEAFGSVQQEMPGAEFWILGSGPEKVPLEGMARALDLHGKVKFLGTVAPQEIPSWLRRCDIGVLATRQDVFLDYSFSNKLSEYIIAGKAVVSSRLRTIRHYFSEDALAFFEPNSAADLSRQMLRLYRDPRQCAQQADKARLEYHPLRWDVMKDRYLTVVNELSGEGAASKEQSVASLTGTLGG